MPPEDARKRFSLIVKKSGPSEVALRLKCSENMVRRLVDGSRTPGMKMARAIEELYEIEMQAWVPAPTVETVKRIA